MHIDDHEKCNWIRQRLEEESQKQLSVEDIQVAVQRLIRASKYCFLFLSLLAEHRL